MLVEGSLTWPVPIVTGVSKQLFHLAITAVSILMSGGQGRLKPSPGNFFVACKPSLLSKALSLATWSAAACPGVCSRPASRDKAGAGVGRIAKQHGAALQPHPVRSQRRRRQAEYQRARRLQPALDSQVNIVPRLDDPLIEPHPPPRRPQPFRQPPHSRLVCRVVAQEYVVLEVLGH